MAAANQYNPPPSSIKPGATEAATIAQSRFVSSPNSNILALARPIGIARFMQATALISAAGWVARRPSAHFAAPLVLPNDYCAPFYACEPAIFSEERASAQLAPLSREARGIEPSNRYHFVEVILSRGCTWTSQPPEGNRQQTNLNDREIRFQTGNLAARHLAAILPHKMLTTLLPQPSWKEILLLLNNEKITESAA